MLPEEIDEEFFHRQMTTHTLPDVDLLIRTGGETRVSDFLLFESAYAELVFLPIMWPDFRPQTLLDAIAIYVAKGAAVRPDFGAGARAWDAGSRLRSVRSRGVSLLRKVFAIGERAYGLSTNQIQ